MMPFEQLRVVEIGSGVALAYCGKLFAAFGAEVIKAEPPGGDERMRTMPPLVETGGGRRESGYFAWLNTNKRSIAAAAESDAGAARLRSLIDGADVLLDSRPPGEVAHPLLDHAALRLANPRLVICAISWFGENGPYRDFAATEAVCRALTGGIHAIGPADGPPVIPIDGQSGVIAGLAAYIAAASGLYNRDDGGRRFSVSIHETLMHAMEMDFSSALTFGHPRQRFGVNKFGRHYPSSIYRTRDGWIGISTVTPAQWRGFCAMMERPDIGADPRYASSGGRADDDALLDAVFKPLLAQRSSAEWFEAGLKHRLALVIVPSMAELLAQSIHRDRGAFVPVRIGDAVFEAPTIPQRMGDGGPMSAGRAPLAGEDDAAFPAVAAPARRPATAGEPGSPAKMPLAGMRIVDLTMGWAGPLATRLLGDLGAEIIKVESCIYPDWWRGADRNASFFDQRLYEKNNNYNMMNRNKLAVTLDLTRPEGVAALKQLVAQAHGLIENYSVDVMPKLGLTYDVLRAVRRDLVMVSMAAFGSNNAWSRCRAYGGTLEQASGLPSVTGDESWPPTMSSYAYGDPVGGFNAATAMLTGLLLQKRGGEGRHVDMSQIEGLLPLIAGKIIEQSVNGTVGPRLGNRHPTDVPHGCFRCAGADDWVVIAVTDTEQWRALCEAIGRNDLAQDVTLATAAGRREREAEIERAIGAWTARHSAREAMVRLQARHVPAGAALTATEALQDPHLQARAFWQTRERPFVGSCMMLSAPFRETDEPYPIRRASPTLGQDNADVFRRLLGWSDVELAAFAEQRIIGTEAFADTPKQRSAVA
jgi:crotonobetainyl-CoA:carnitine CoA-transferase CaiB-like acyl-CoA transferase